MQLRNVWESLKNRLDIVAVVFGLAILWVASPIIYANGYSKVYYIAIGIAMVAIATYIFYFRGINVADDRQVKDRNAWLLLGLICAAGLMQVWFINIDYFGSLIGLDPWTHKRITTQELEIALGLVPNTEGINALTFNTIGGYFSLMHLYLRGWIELTGLDYKWAALIFSSSVNIVGTIVITYLVGKELAGKSTGLIAAYCVSWAGWVVMYSEWNIPNSCGGLFCLLVAYFIIKAYKTDRLWIAWLSLIPLIISFFVHILVAVWVIGTILCCGILSFSKYKTGLPLSALGLFLLWYRYSSVTNAAEEVATTMQVTPAFSQPVPSEPITAVVNPIVITPVEAVPAKTITYIDYLNADNIGELAVDSIGMFLYIGVAIIGLLMMLRGNGINKIWGILCAGTLAIGFIAPILGISILKDRWWYLIEVFMAIPLAVTMVGILKGRCVQR